MVVHVDDANNIQTIAGRALPSVTVDTTARIGAAAAAAAALDTTAKAYGPSLIELIHEIRHQPPNGQTRREARRLDSCGLNHSRIPGVAPDHEIGE